MELTLERLVELEFSMTNILDEAKTSLQHDFGLPSAEWKYLESLIEKSESERLPLLKWVFEESPAFWDTRAKAGMVLLQEDEADTWQSIKRLVESTDPDDNGTALTIFEITGESKGIELAQTWLSIDTHPATQIEAVRFLKDIVPDKVWNHVLALARHENPDFQRLGKDLADELNAA
jgi:hypothetical protein